jgi:hypothetical protein
LAVALTLEQIDQRLAVIAEAVSHLRTEIQSMRTPRQEQQPQPLNQARVDAAGHFDPISALRVALRSHFNQGRSWDVCIDLIDQNLLLSAQREFAMTIGKSDGHRRVDGFRQYVCDGIIEEAA